MKGGSDLFVCVLALALVVAIVGFLQDWFFLPGLRSVSYREYGRRTIVASWTVLGFIDRDKCVWSSNPDAWAPRWYDCESGRLVDRVWIKSMSDRRAEEDRRRRMGQEDRWRKELERVRD